MASKKLFLASTVLFVLVSLPLLSSVVASSEMWSQTYGGTEGDLAYALVVTSDGGFALAGVSNSFGGFWLVKTDSYGNMEWNKTYGGGTARSLIQTSDGGFALAGEIIPSGAARDFSLVKTDADGNMQWNRTYGGEDSDLAYSLVETSDGGFALAGVTHSFDGLWLVKTDANGNMMWNRTYGEGSVWDTYSLVVTSDGEFAIGGNMLGDFWLVKTDNYGNIEWSRTYGGTSNDQAHSLIQTSDGGYALAGKTYSFDVGQGDFWLVKTDADGNMEWNRTYGGKSIDIASSLVEVPGDGFALAGYTNSLGAGSHDFWLVKTDAQGIPEFPSWIILPLLLVATLVAMICKQRLPKNIEQLTTRII